MPVNTPSAVKGPGDPASAGGQRAGEDIGSASFGDNVHILRGGAKIGPREEQAAELLNQRAMSPQ